MQFFAARRYHNDIICFSKKYRTAFNILQCRSKASYIVRSKYDSAHLYQQKQGINLSRHKMKRQIYRVAEKSEKEWLLRLNVHLASYCVRSGVKSISVCSSLPFNIPHTVDTIYFGGQCRHRRVSDNFTIGVVYEEVVLPRLTVISDHNKFLFG